MNYLRSLLVVVLAAVCLVHLPCHAATYAGYGDEPTPSGHLGLAPMIAEKNPDLLKLAFGKKIAGLVYAGKYGNADSCWFRAVG